MAARRFVTLQACSLEAGDGPRWSATSGATNGPHSYQHKPMPKWQPLLAVRQFLPAHADADAEESVTNELWERTSISP